MKINTKIKNILLKRFLVTFGIILLIRVGTFLPVPGINHSDLAFYIQSHSATRILVNTFSGENTFIVGLFTLNIFPYINASILVQLVVALSPELSRLQKDGELEGRRSINRLTRLITLIVAIFQSLSIAIYMKQILFNWNYTLALEIVIWLTTGAMIILWLSELITDYGLGNGASLFIYINIVSSLPNLFNAIYGENGEGFQNSSTILIILLLLTSLIGIVFLQEGIRMIPLVSSKQLNQANFTDDLGLESSSFIPLRLNQAGVMPIILTTSILVFPNYISSIGLLPKIDFLKNSEYSSYFSILYWVVYFLTILLFSSFYSTIVLNPKDLSDQLQKMSVTIPGVRPGIQTTFYLQQVMQRTTLVGAFLLATLVTIPNYIESALMVTSFNGLSSTSLLIISGVVLDLVREVKNIYFSDVYSSLYQ